MSWTRVRAIFVKELRDYRRNRSIMFTMAIMPAVYIVLPIVDIFASPAVASSAGLDKRIGLSLLYMLFIPAVVPATLAAYSVVGEREQGTLEPVLTTPIRPEEFLLGKALAVLLPTLSIAYLMFGVFLALRRTLRSPRHRGRRLSGSAPAHPAALHAAASRLVDLGGHRDLGALERRPYRSATGHVRQPAAAGGYCSPVLWSDPGECHARPWSWCSAAARGRPRLAARVSHV